MALHDSLETQKETIAIMIKRALAALLFTATSFSLASTAQAAERLCDASVENCRTPLIDLINNETQGIDVGVWFFKDDRFVTALVNAKKRGVPMRIIMDPRANATYPANGPELDKLSAAGIPMRKRIAGDICHWKLMIFAGQGVVEWSGANFSPTAFVPQDPYNDYEDEVIYFSEQLVPSFMTMFDNIWTNTKEYANYANVPPTLVRNYPTNPIDARLNFPPKDSYQDRLVPLIDAEPVGGWIDVDIYRITMARPVDALIRAASRGIRIRMYLEPNEYSNPDRPGNKVQMDRLVAAAQQYPGTIEIRMRNHLGLNHQKTVWFHGQHVVAFGTSNWSDASDDNQLEANIFTDKLKGDPLNDQAFDDLYAIFNRKWHNSHTGSTETVAWRTPTLPDPTPSNKCLDPGATNYGGPLPCAYPPPPPPPPPPDPNATTVVVYPAKGTITGSRWQTAADTTAAGGTALWNPDLAQAKVAPALSAPASYVEKTFSAMANTPYHVWVRMRAQNNSSSNDSIHIQFDNAVTGPGSTTTTMKLGTTSSAEFVLQDGPSGGANVGWGWADNGWGTPGDPIYFGSTGTQTLRIQQREDGPFVDQIVISPTTYFTAAPGPHTSDATILPEGSMNDSTGTPSCSFSLSKTTTAAAAAGGNDSVTVTAGTSCTWTAASNATWISVTSGASGSGNGTVNLSVAQNTGAARSGTLTIAGTTLTVSQAAPPPAGAKTVVLYASEGAITGLRWQVVTDTTAAGNAALWNPNKSEGKVAPALAAPASFVEMPFDAVSGVPYHIWVRMRAEGNSTSNDSVHIQFSDTVTGSASTTATLRINSSSSAEFVLQQGSTGAAPASWGWTDNGWGTPGDPIFFENSGSQHTLRIQQREDGPTIDQIVLSPDTYLTARPGATSNDQTRLPKTGGTPSCTFTLSKTSSGAAADGGSDSVTVTAGAGCAWNATPNASWISVTSGASGSGAGTVAFNVAANDTTAARTGTLTIGGQTLTVTQAAPAPPPTCTVTLSASSASLPASGGSGTVNVTADPSCAWSAASGASWITATGSGSGNGVVDFGGAANTGAARSGTITILDKTFTVSEDAATAPPDGTDVILHPSTATTIVGRWQPNADPTAVDGVSLLNPNTGAAKIGTAMATPTDYFEMTFDAVAGTPYRIWLRGKATSDSFANDSVYLQFEDSVASDGVTPLYGFGTTNALMWSLEDCSNCGVAAWGWQDAGGYGAGISGPQVYFRTTGQQRLRIQVREDGVALDQIVLSPQRYLTASPGAGKNDTTIVQ
jgi:phosphatidylserine/phosphatidylglycerophosphate/cardiolipin synthase-like enzyme